MIDPVCSLLNLLLSVERHWWTNVAEPNAELLISKNDYDARIDELKAAGSAILWNLSNNMRTHHWSAVMHIGATAFPGKQMPRQCLAEWSRRSKRVLILPLPRRRKEN